MASKRQVISLEQVVDGLLEDSDSDVGSDDAEILESSSGDELDQPDDFEEVVTRFRTTEDPCFRNSVFNYDQDVSSSDVSVYFE